MIATQSVFETILTSLVDLQTWTLPAGLVTGLVTFASFFTREIGEGMGGRPLW